jgi:hypothetical protein
MNSFFVAGADVEPITWLRRFRTDFYTCLDRRADELFELMDALVCTDHRVHSPVELSLAPEHARGHGALYDGLNHGTVAIRRLRRTLAGLPLPRLGGQIVLAVDVSCWLRPEAVTSPERLYCHVTARVRTNSQRVPGWPYSIVAAVESGHTSWTAVLDAVRLTQTDDVTAVTATQLREVVSRLIDAGHWHPGDPNILIVMDAGYDVVRLTHQLTLTDNPLPVTLIARLRSNRVLSQPAPPPDPTQPPARGRRRRHGPDLALTRPTTWPTATSDATTPSPLYGTVQVTAFTRIHAKLTHTGPWLSHPNPLPIIEGTLIRLQVDHLPADRHPRPIWLWTSTPTADPTTVERAWTAYLRRFDLEHTFRYFKQHLGWTTPKLRDPTAADTWTWLVITAHTQLRLARGLTHDLRRPWEHPTPDTDLTPTRVRRGFRRLHRKLPHPAKPPKTPHPGPGRPPGTPNHHPAPHHTVGKTTKRPTTRQYRALNG